MKEKELEDAELILHVAAHLRRQMTTDLIRDKSKVLRVICVPEIIGHFVGAARLIHNPRQHYCSSKISGLVARGYVSHAERYTRAVGMQIISTFYAITEQGRQRLSVLKV